ncbi:MTRF1L release factor glutamine methyltransferase isoform X1 [Protopterus annectens]|uniref:MTRF1L release factor glutamine methyltransferase isoform X1 n=1 Tax=Protopterus annectens TaxID=7888 RepID=UPI001CFB7051|nr:MTRF1L release factor glutamine methyltransferase isoform X1 [Protopterus annectens]XP_043933855.1 MTRF1L release factor glutamine methyltransferase isoform X1 [Protopterus annectens]XP_043933856.1 MTRF1L release factor glutamine methyltransferase isoform X1 [Protopterus annectens]
MSLPNFSSKTVMAALLFHKLRKHFRCLPVRHIQLSKILWHSCLTDKRVSTPTVLGCMAYWRQIFEENDIPEPQHSAEYIIAHVLRIKTFQSMRSEQIFWPVSADQKDRIWQLCKKRLQRMPIQYVIEEWDFRELTLKMKPPVFIPRPETEELVNLVLEEFSQSSYPGKNPTSIFLEVGCGSGALSISLLHSLPQSHAVAIDKSVDAIKLSLENAERLNVHTRAEILQLDILTDAEELLLLLTQKYGLLDFIISNPPYVFQEDFIHLAAEILNYEDHGALNGGYDGMQVIKAILCLAPHVLKDCGPRFCVLQKSMQM